jgi:hypothetical protein
MERAGSALHPSLTYETGNTAFFTERTSDYGGTTKTFMLCFFFSLLNKNPSSFSSQFSLLCCTTTRRNGTILGILGWEGKTGLSPGFSGMDIWELHFGRLFL